MTPPREREPPPLGQHFLVDAEALDHLVGLAAPRPGEHALDVGAGPGAITSRLCDAVGPGGRVVAVELDPHLARRLRNLHRANLTVAEGDALTVTLPRPDVVVSNPPFQVAAPLLLRLLSVGFGRAALVLPRELADRLLARPGSERYGRLTVQVAVRARVRKPLDLPPLAFDPPPRVRASVVVVEPKALPEGLELAVLEAVLAAAWRSKDRTLRHGLASLAGDLRLSSGRITEVLRAREWSARKPGELSPSDYVALAKALQP